MANLIISPACGKLLEKKREFYILKGIDKYKVKVYNRGILNIIRKETMKESERLRKENDLLQRQIEGQLTDINREISEMIKTMRSI